MSYFDVNLLANNQDFMNRSVACAATEQIPDPFNWALAHRFEIAAAPGFGADYASALAADPPVQFPGRDESVISDGELLGSVQAVRAAEIAPG
jgi:hypothetical protein